MATNVTPQSAVSSKHTSQPRQSWWASLVILCAVLGALIGLSVKSRDMLRRQNIPADNYAALAERYLMVKHNADQETLTIAALQKRVSEYENGTASDTKQEKALLDDLNQTKFLAGLTPVLGPGLVVTLNDSKEKIPPQMQASVPVNIIHDTDINAVVNELKAAGAEAISVNSQRLVATSPIRCAGPTVLINDVPQTPPYVIRAVGDGKVMQAALDIPGGVRDQIKGFDPAMIKTQIAPRVLIPAYVGASQPKYAKPILTPGAAQ